VPVPVPEEEEEEEEEEGEPEPERRVASMVRSVANPQPPRGPSPDPVGAGLPALVPILHKNDQVLDKKIVRIPSTITHFVP
jgi:hypothetical protein